MQQGNPPVTAESAIHVAADGSFDVVVRPHRSLGPRGFAILMGAVVAFSFAAGLLFYAMGAWPVTGFFGLDAALIYWAFKANYGSARAHERIMMKQGGLILRQCDAQGRTRQWQFEPYWARLDLETGSAGDTRLYLGSHGKRIAIAGCLSDEERVAFAGALRQALAASRR